MRGEKLATWEGDITWGQMKTVTLSALHKPTYRSTYLHCHQHGPSIGRVTGGDGVKATGEGGAKDRPVMPREEEGGWSGDRSRLSEHPFRLILALNWFP